MKVHGVNIHGPLLVFCRTIGDRDVGKKQSNILVGEVSSRFSCLHGISRLA